MKRIIGLVLIFAAMFVFIGCGKDNNSIDKHNENILESMSSVKVVNSSIKVFDTEVLVYEVKTVTTMLENNSAEVVKTTSALGSNFALETTETRETIDSVNKNEFFKLNLKEEFLESIEYTDGNLSCEVKAENFQKVFNTEKLEISGNAKLVFNYNDKKITEIKVTFDTASSKNVVATVTFTY